MLAFLRKLFHRDQPRDAYGRWATTGTKVLVRGTGAAAEWKRRMGQTPRAYFQELLHGTGLTVGVLKVVRTKAGELKYDAWLTKPDGSHAGWLERAFHDDERGFPVVEHKSFTLARDLQGKGIAKQVMRNAWAQYDRMGLAEVRAHSALGAGGLVWLKFGFLPHDKVIWQDLKRQIDSRIYKLPVAARVAYRKILQSDDPRTAWVIADSKYAHQLLERTNYHSTFSFGNAAQRRRFRAYVKP